MLNALTVDVEDYFHVTAFDNHIRRDEWERFPSRVERNTRRLLDLFDRMQTRGTFFILGWVAHHFPHLVREILQAGHEIGSHSYWHHLIYAQTPKEFRRDVRMGRDVIEQIIGQAVTAYRAPTFSITERSLWALDILREEGFRVDSSIFPIHHDRYGIPDAPRPPHRPDRVAGDFWEVPPSVLRWGAWNLPIAGGGYFRMYPLWLTCSAIRRLHRANIPFVFYIHPWELDPDQPRIALAPWKRWRHYVNLAGTQSKLEALLRTFAFGSIGDVLLEFTEAREGRSQQAGTNS